MFVQCGDRTHKVSLVADLNSTWSSMQTADSNDDVKIFRVLYPKGKNGTAITDTTISPSFC